MLKRILLALAILITVAQSFAASASVSPVHCQTDSQSQLICNFDDSDTSEHDMKLTDCHSCCHCHGNAHLYIHADQQQNIHADRQSSIRFADIHFYSLFLTEENPPPIA